MNKIDFNASQAFWNGKEFNELNRYVIPQTNGMTKFYLYRSVIAITGEATAYWTVPSEYITAITLRQLNALFATNPYNEPGEGDTIYIDAGKLKFKNRHIVEYVQPGVPYPFKRETSK